MPFAPTDIIIRKPVDTTQTNNAGGVMDHSPNAIIVSGQYANLFPEIEYSVIEEGRSGESKIREKIFLHNTNPDNLKALNVRVFTRGSGSSHFTASLIEATHSDTYVIAKIRRKYGAATLASVPTYDAGTNTTTIVANTNGASYAHFTYTPGDDSKNMIAISDLESLSDTTGKVEFFTIKEAPTWNGSQVTLKMTGELRKTFATSRIQGSATIATMVSSVIVFPHMNGLIEVSQNTSAHGTVNAEKIKCSNRGTISQIITVTFAANGTDFTAVSSQGNLLSSGSILADWSPTNESGYPYFTIPSDAWENDGNGAWTQGDSVKITTYPTTVQCYATLDFPPNASNSEDVTVRMYHYVQVGRETL